MDFHFHTYELSARCDGCGCGCDEDKSYLGRQKREGKHSKLGYATMISSPVAWGCVPMTDEFDPVKTDDESGDQDEVPALGDTILMPKGEDAGIEA